MKTIGNLAGPTNKFAPCCWYNLILSGSVNTISSYIKNMENSWLVFTLNLYDFPSSASKSRLRKSIVLTQV